MSAPQDAVLLQLAYYFVSKHQYRFVSTAKNQDEVWLSNPLHPTYPIIRISNNTLSSTYFDKERIKLIYQAISSHISTEAKLLDIHTYDEPLQEADEDFIQAIVHPNQEVIEELEETFNDIKEAVLPVKNPQTDYQRMVSRINELHQSGAKKMRQLSRKDMPWISILFGALTMGIFLAITMLNLRFGNTLGEPNETSVGLAILFGAHYKAFVLANHEYWRFLTAGFVHIDFFHILINSIALMNLGFITEKIFGKVRFSLILFGSIIMGTWFVFVAQGNGVTLGSSAGLYGLMGALLVYTFETGSIRQPIVRSQFTRILMINLFISFLPGISLFGHLGGFVGGILLAILLSKNDKWKTLRTNTIISLIGLIAVLGIYTAQPKDLDRLYLGTDQMVITMVRELGFEGYANQLQASLNKFYGGQ